MLLYHWVPRKTETVGECWDGGNAVEDIRPMIVPGFDLQVAARKVVKGSRRAKDVPLTRLSRSVSPKDVEGKCLCCTSQSKRTGWAAVTGTWTFTLPGVCENKSWPPWAKCPWGAGDRRQGRGDEGQYSNNISWGRHYNECKFEFKQRLKCSGWETVFIFTWASFPYTRPYYYFKLWERTNRRK